MPGIHPRSYVTFGSGSSDPSLASGNDGSGGGARVAAVRLAPFVGGCAWSPSRAPLNPNCRKAVGTRGADHTFDHTCI